MKSKQDGQGVADYVAETKDDIDRLVAEKGRGGKGLHETKTDAALRGVTPDIAAEAERHPIKPRPGDE
jgi:hypothetical protein